MFFNTAPPFFGPLPKKEEEDESTDRRPNVAARTSEAVKETAVRAAGRG